MHPHLLILITLSFLYHFNFLRFFSATVAIQSTTWTSALGESQISSLNSWVRQMCVCVHLNQSPIWAWLTMGFAHLSSSTHTMAVSQNAAENRPPISSVRKQHRHLKPTGWKHILSGFLHHWDCWWMVSFINITPEGFRPESHPTDPFTVNHSKHERGECHLVYQAAVCLWTHQHLYGRFNEECDPNAKCDVEVNWICMHK